MKLKVVFVLLTLFLIFNIVDTIYSQDLQEEKWGVFSTRFCTVFYEPGVDLDSLNKYINLRFADFYNPGIFREKKELSIEEILSEKFDAIFERVEEVLDMHSSRIHVTIRIYEDGNSLDAIYEEIFEEPNEALSFYIYKTNTIYIDQNVIDEKMLAHEMAHCIIDHYFVILPPRKIQEMLAVYADVHLKD